MTSTWSPLLVAALAAVSLPIGLTAQAAEEHPAVSTTHNRPETNSKCPSHAEVESALANASTAMSQEQFQGAAKTLQTLAAMDCDPRVSLLFAAAIEATGDPGKATLILLRAHSVWPSNSSIATSLARQYLATKQVDKAAKALVGFHAAAAMPEQELEMATVVYLAANKLIAAQTTAGLAYKSYPSLHTLLLYANTLQLQGRYPEVNRLLGARRTDYADSADFFITLAESEFDASLLPEAREDLKQAILLSSGSYQAHYLMGNVLGRMNDPDGAIAEYKLAIDLAPGQPRTYYQLALVLRSKQDEAGEERVLIQALVSDDRYAPAQCELGRIVLKDGRPADAVSHLSAAIQYNPRSEEAYFLLARAYSRLGEKDKSAEMVKRLIAIRKENRPRSKGSSLNLQSGNQAGIANP